LPPQSVRPVYPEVRREPRRVYPEFRRAILRASTTPSRQVLCNPHLRNALGSADSKRFTSATILPQVLYNLHLHTPSASAGNKRLITPVESALTKNAPATPLESALPKKWGGTPSSQKRALLFSRETPTFASASFPCTYSLLQKECSRQLFSPQQFTHSFAKHPGWVYPKLNDSPQRYRRSTEERAKCRI
jgi:hypothetical protein